MPLRYLDQTENDEPSSLAEVSSRLICFASDAAARAEELSLLVAPADERQESRLSVERLCT